MTHEHARAQRVVNAFKTERGLRQQVRAAGCRLHQSRRDEGRYMIFDLEQDGIAAGEAFQLTLDDVEAWISEREHPYLSPYRR